MVDRDQIISLLVRVNEESVISILSHLQTLVHKSYRSQAFLKAACIEAFYSRGDVCLLSSIPDALNAMYRVESEQSIGDSDENIMEHMTEGGVTILKQLDRKRQVGQPLIWVLTSSKA